MGWGLRILAFLVALMSFGLGAWPVSLLAFAYIVLSFRKPNKKEVYVLKQQQPIQQPGRPWGRYVLGGSVTVVALVALRSGGTFSPVVLAAAGMTILLWPSIKTGRLVNRVRPVKDSVLLRSSFLPFVWHALAEVKLETENPTRAVSSLEGRILLFAGRTPSAFLGLRSLGFSYKGAEKRILTKLRKASRQISSRGGYLLPLDSQVAAAKLSVTLERVDLEPGDIEAASSLPFDVFVMDVEKARVVSHGAFRVSDEAPVAPFIPQPNLRPVKQPLLWELAEMIGEKHGWPDPDMYTSFLSSLHATRGEALGDRLTNGKRSGALTTVQSLGGTIVELTRAQLRALAEIYG